MTPERITDLRDRAELQLRRFAEFGGLESNFQVAINPSELLAFLDLLPRPYAIGDRVEVYGLASRQWHDAIIVGVDDWSCSAQLTGFDTEGEVLIRALRDPAQAGLIRRVPRG